MDGRPLPPESHDTAEALLVMDGTLRLVADGTEVEVRAGEMCIVEGGVEHAVRSGSRGTLVIIEHIAGATRERARVHEGESPAPVSTSSVSQNAETVPPHSVTAAMG
ncbi:cupin domain-containing protein [Streptomyces viridiviolaceus]